MGERLAIRSNLLFTELLVQRTIKDVGKILGGPCLAVPVSVGHFFSGGLIEEKCDEVRYNQQILKHLPWLPAFVTSRFVAVREGTTI